jgi:putative hydrolase of the HAD superfamily
MSPSPPDAVLFDLDRTLCESTQDFSAVLSSTFDQVGVDPYCTVTDMEAVVGATPECESDREFFEALFALAADRVGAGDVPTGELAATYESQLDYSQVAFRPGAEAAVVAARDHGPVGLVTNGGRDTQTTKLEALGIADAFDTAVFCDPAAGMPTKPDPTPFRTAVDDLGVAPEACVHVGDSNAEDVAGAHAAGLRSAWVPYDEATDDVAHDPHHTFEAPDDVTDLLG